MWSRGSHLGVKICLFWRKRVLFDSVKGHLGVIFQTPPNMSSKKSLFRGKFGSKIVRNLRLGCVFPGEGKLGLAYVSTLVFECPPPTPVLCADNHCPNIVCVYLNISWWSLTSELLCWYLKMHYKWIVWIYLERGNSSFQIFLSSALTLRTRLGITLQYPMQCAPH